jgi:uncharacterized protein (TIGR02466 family)
MELQNFLESHETAEIHEYLMDRKRLNQTNRHDAILNDGTSSHGSDTNIIDSVNLADRVQTALNHYTDAYGRKRLKVTDSWYSIQNEGSVLKQHTHSGSIASAVVYINTPQGSNKLYFNNPNALVEYTNEAIVEPNEFNYEWYSVEAVAGTMIIFPSWLSHGSYYHENQSESRTIISLNTRYE